MNSRRVLLKFDCFCFHIQFYDNQKVKFLNLTHFAIVSEANSRDFVFITQIAKLKQSLIILNFAADVL